MKKSELKPTSVPAGRPSALIDTRVIYCGGNLEQLVKLPDGCVDLIHIDPPFNSNRNREIHQGETNVNGALENPQRGFFVAFGYKSDVIAKCSAFHKKTGRIIKLITVEEILEEQHTQKM